MRDEVNGINMSDVLFQCIQGLRQAEWFPFDTGHLKYDAMYLNESGFEIIFDGNKAPYIDYLEYGTKAHIIHNAFGKGITVQIPASNKHKGFIEIKSFSKVCDIVCSTLKGRQIL